MAKRAELSSTVPSPGWLCRFTGKCPKAGRCVVGAPTSDGETVETEFRCVVCRSVGHESRKVAA